MSWPIILRRALSDAVLGATRAHVETLAGEERAVYAIVLSQMERGISLDFEEQELLRAALLAQLRTSPSPDLETAYFRLFGVWAIRPTWWQVQRDQKNR